MKNVQTILILLLGLFMYSACSDDDTTSCDDPNATYEASIKSIIDNSCAYSGCHDGQGGIGPGDFTNYTAILNFTSNFQSRVIAQKDDAVNGMPPDMSTYPESMKDNLTASELELFECWISQGFPEN